MPPPRSSARRSRPHPAFSRQGSNAGAAGYRTRFENAHRIACREVLYRLHPWFGREVFVQAAIDKADGAIFQCSVDGSDAERWREIPAWMFDHGACAGDVRFSTAPFVCLEALRALSTLLDQVLKTTSGSSNTQLSGACGISHDQNRGENHGTEVHGGGDRESAQAAPRSTADGFVRGPDNGRRTRLARPAGGGARSVGQLDDAADPGACGRNRDADNEVGGRP